MILHHAISLATNSTGAPLDVHTISLTKVHATLCSLTTPIGLNIRNTSMTLYLFLNIDATNLEVPNLNILLFFKAEAFMEMHSHLHKSFCLKEQ
jgi:hypothetical protein